MAFQGLLLKAIRSDTGETFGRIQAATQPTDQQQPAVANMVILAGCHGDGDVMMLWLEQAAEAVTVTWTDGSDEGAGPVYLESGSLFFS